MRGQIATIFTKFYFRVIGAGKSYNLYLSAGPLWFLDFSKVRNYENAHSMSGLIFWTTFYH